MIKIKLCKKCGIKAIKNGWCYEHFLEYQREYRKKNIEKFKQYDINKKLSAKPKKCRQCKKEFVNYYNQYFCSRQCNYDNWKEKETRKGKKNFGYRNGFYTGKKKLNSKHSNACRKYRVALRKERGYDYCERCGVNQSPRFETHHIIYLSEAPDHPEIDNPKNLIFLCIKCHNELHGKKILRNDIVEKRGLSELFGRNCKVYAKNISETIVSKQGVARKKI